MCYESRQWQNNHQPKIASQKISLPVGCQRFWRMCHFILGIVKLWVYALDKLLIAGMMGV
jgi:hypothetical protein